MLRIETLPVAVLTCPQCHTDHTLTGGTPVVCCGRQYSLSLLVHEADADAVAAFHREIKRQLALSADGGRVTVPPAPLERAVASLWEPPLLGPK